jgi:hypothetical protein
MDLAIISKVLQMDARRVEHAMAGDHRCTYLIDGAGAEISRVQGSHQSGEDQEASIGEFENTRGERT